MSWTQGNLKLNIEGLFNPSLESFASVAAGRQNLFQTIPDRLWDFQQQFFGSGAFANIGRMSQHAQQIAHTVDQNMTFASVGLLSSIKAMFSANFRRFHALAVDNR